jgi:hypothetical protein
VKMKMKMKRNIRWRARTVVVVSVARVQPGLALHGGCIGRWRIMLRAHGHGRRGRLEGQRRRS